MVNESPHKSDGAIYAPSLWLNMRYFCFSLLKSDSKLYKLPL